MALTLAFAALVWCAFLAPIVTRAYANSYDEEPRAWIANLTGLHDFAEAVAGAHVYDIAVGRAGWMNRRTWPVAVVVGAGLVLAVAATAALDYWPHGVIAG